MATAQILLHHQANKTSSNKIQITFQIFIFGDPVKWQSIGLFLLRESFVTSAANGFSPTQTIFIKQKSCWQIKIADNCFLLALISSALS
jgi:hypothetical protein